MSVSKLGGCAPIRIPKKRPAAFNDPNGSITPASLHQHQCLEGVGLSRLTFGWDRAEPSHTAGSLDRSFDVPAPES